MKHSVPAGDHRHLVTGRGDHDRMATGGLYKVDVACVRAGVATRSPSTRAEPRRMRRRPKASDHLRMPTALARGPPPGLDPVPDPAPISRCSTNRVLRPIRLPSFSASFRESPHLKLRRLR